MAYIGLMNVAEIADYQNDRIQLTQEGWEHIQKRHPEITIEAIESALKSPDEVRKSTHTGNSKCQKLVYYKAQLAEGRFTEVVVKFCEDGNFISTALTTSAMKLGEQVFKKGDT